MKQILLYILISFYSLCTQAQLSNLLPTPQKIEQVSGHFHTSKNRDKTLNAITFIQTDTIKEAPSHAQESLSTTN